MFGLAIPMVDNDVHPHLTFTAMLLLTFSLLLSIAYYYKTLLSDPGYLPEGLAAPVHAALPESIFKNTCEKCEDRWKPPRAYHCRVCDRCVFKVAFDKQMDHHCIWVNNCIGAGNTKFFAQLVVISFWYSVIFSAICTAACCNMLGYWGDSIVFKIHGSSPTEKVVYL